MMCLKSMQVDEDLPGSKGFSGYSASPKVETLQII